MKSPGRIAALLLTLQGCLLAYGALIHSPTFDETAHLPAGLAYWKLGREDIYPHNPPLVRTLAALPVLFAGSKDAWGPKEIDSSVRRPEFELGRNFVFRNGERAFWLYTLGRWMCLPFCLLGGYVCYRWGSELYGPWAGVLSLWLWCFCPNVLGSGQWIAPDMGATALGLSAGYLFWKWLGNPTWRFTFAAGAVLGLAELSKFTWVILFVLWPLLWLLVRRTSQAKLGQLVVILALGLYVLNLGYLFRGTLQPLGKGDYYSQALGGPQANPAGGVSGNRFRGQAFGSLPVPLPRAYLVGVDLQKLDFENGYPSYLRGEWKHGGWWYYYLYGLGIKTPLGTLALFGWALLVGRRMLKKGIGDGTQHLESRRDLLCLLAPPAVILTLVSSQTGFNHHLRYVLPAVPFALISIGRLLAASLSRRRLIVIGALAACTALESLSVYPHSASFFNLLVGGPKHGADHLVDSNISWGQDLLLLRDWLEERNLQDTTISLAYFGNLDPCAAGIKFRPPRLGPIARTTAAADKTPGDPDLGPVPGLHIVDVNLVYGLDQFMPDGQGGRVRPKVAQTDLSYFRAFEPRERIGYSLYVYDLSVDQVNKERAARGIKRWPNPQDR